MSSRYYPKFNSISLFILFLTYMLFSFVSAEKAESSNMKKDQISKNQASKVVSLDSVSSQYHHHYEETLDSIDAFKLKADEMSAKFKDMKIHFNGFKQSSFQLNKAMLIMLALSSLFIVLIVALSSNLENLQKYEESRFNMDFNLKNSHGTPGVFINKQKKPLNQPESKKENPNYINIELSKNSKETKETKNSTQKPYNYITKDITFNDEFNHLLRSNENVISRSINDTFEYDDKEDFKDIISYI